MVVDGGQLDPASISVLCNPNGESSYALRVEGRDSVVVGSVRPILHEKPKFNAFQESMPIFKKNATKYLRRITVTTNPITYRVVPAGSTALKESCKCSGTSEESEDSLLSSK